MQAIKQDLLVELMPEFSGAFLRHGRANENFPVGKSDHVSFGWIAEKIAMHASHGRAIDQDELDLVKSLRQRPGKKRQRRFKPPQKWTNR